MTFGRYAQYYDAIYQSKAYAKECAYLERLLKKYSPRKVATVLDLGCGTANHMIPFLNKGYKAVGVDASARMLNIAAEKLKSLHLKARLEQGKLQSFRLGRKFDAVLCLFSVIDYLTKKADVAAMLENVSGHMKRGSVFVFDFWHACAVADNYSPRKVNVYRDNGRLIERRSATKVYPARRLCEVDYVCTVREKGRPVRRDKEKHVLRYFGIEEMHGYLHKAGMTAVDEHPFMDPGGTIRRDTWDVTMVAKKN